MRSKYARPMLPAVWRPERIASCRSAIVVSSNSNGLGGATTVSLLSLSFSWARADPEAGERSRAVLANPARKKVPRFLATQKKFRGVYGARTRNLRRDRAAL